MKPQTIAKVLVLFCAFVLPMTGLAQNYLSVPFNSGFIGRIGNNPQNADTILNFSTLGVSNGYFIQNSSTGQFEVQGNDITGVVRLVSITGQVLDVDGAIVWRENAGQEILLFGFNPADTVPQVDLSTIGTGVSYDVDANSNYGLIPNGGTYTAADSSSVNGNAASSGLLDALNAYLDSVQTNQPIGPVAVDDSTTNDVTPTLTGDVTLGAGESFTVIVDGVSYDTSSGLTIVGTEWSLTLGNTSPGTYEVTGVISNSDGFTLSALGTLIISGCEDATACNFGDASNPCSYATTWYADADGDGLGDSGTTQSACTQPAGYVSDGSDLCDDNTACNYDANSVANAACTFGTTWYRDADNDGLGDSGDTQQACSAPAGYVADSSDLCDDTTACNYDANSVANAACTYATTWYADDDGDSLGDAGTTQSACTQPAGYVADSSDLCDDSTACNYDANSVANAACTYATTWYADDDGDSLGDAGTTQSACTQPAGYVADNSDNCDDLAATNYNDAGNPPCAYAGAVFTALDSLLGCENQANVSMDLDTMHVGSGTWTYTIDENIVGFASGSISANLVEIDFSSAGIGRDTIEISGNDGSNSVTISLIVQESTYPYWTAINSSDGVSTPSASDGGAIFAFSGHDAAPVTVHYYEDAVMIFDGGINKFAGYGPELTAQTDADGNWLSQPTDAIWVSGYTNIHGCYSPEPATSSAPTSSPKIRQIPIPHLVD